MIVILGTDDGVHICDCCGKSNLKSTVLVDVDGVLFHYGSTCATKHTGLSSLEVNKKLNMITREAKLLAEKEYYVRLNEAQKILTDTPEYSNRVIMAHEARALRLTGIDFRDHTKESFDTYDTLLKKTANEFNVNHWDLL